MRWLTNDSKRATSVEHAGDSRAPGFARLREPVRGSVDSSKALAILTAWQLASYRGYAVVEKRMERRLVVQTLLDRVTAEHLTIAFLVLTADDIARDQWRRLLQRDGALPEGWSVQTPEALLDDGDRVSGDCVVIADELETYLTDDLAAALTNARAILGLCATPGGLGDALHLRKYIGRPLNLSRPTTPFDVCPLADERELRRRPQRITAIPPIHPSGSGASTIPKGFSAIT